MSHPVWQRTRPNDPDDTHTGWVFRSPEDLPLQNSAGRGQFDCEGCVPDERGTRSVRDLYEAANDRGGKYSGMARFVPLVW